MEKYRDQFKWWIILNIRNKINVIRRTKMKKNMGKIDVCILWRVKWLLIKDWRS